MAAKFSSLCPGERNISPGDYLEPGPGAQGRPLFILEQTDPVRIFVGVPELASYFIHEHDTALIRFQAVPGAAREGKVVRSSYSLSPTTRTLQTEVDVPNADGHIHPGWYVTVTIVIDRKQNVVLANEAMLSGAVANTVAVSFAPPSVSCSALPTTLAELPLNRKPLPVAGNPDG